MQSLPQVERCVALERTRSYAGGALCVRERGVRCVRNGFTLVEILVVLSIIAIITTFSILGFRSMYQNSGLRIATEEVRNAFQVARSNTMSSKGDTVFGVHVASSSVTRFVGNTYSASNASNTIYYFEAGATATGTIVTNGINIVFTRLTGIPSATGTVIIEDSDRGSSTTVTIGATGLIQ